MVRAILDGRKTQTRRVIKPQPADGLFFSGWISISSCKPDEGKASFIDNYPLITKLNRIKCPYGKPGDRLWVRETWLPDAPCDGSWDDVAFYGCKGSPLSMIPEHYRKVEHCIYRASWKGHPLIWKPSIHMPRWASRINLEITGIRVERVQDISGTDARAEGIEMPNTNVYNESYKQNDLPIGLFASLWDSINAKRGYSWESNPWVWVIEFKRVDNATNN
jgi:hypothetical protein